MPFNPMPIMCFLSVCEPAKFELQEIKRGEYIFSCLDGFAGIYSVAMFAMVRAGDSCDRTRRDLW